MSTHYILHTVENQTISYSESLTIDCNKEKINAISFKVKGTGEVLINSMPIDATDGIVSYTNNMPVRDQSVYNIIIPAGVILYVIKTRIVKSTLNPISTNC